MARPKMVRSVKNYTPENLGLKQVDPSKDLVSTQEFKYVKGNVAEVSTTKSGMTYINFDNKHPDNIFSAVIFKDNKDAFDFAVLNKCTNIVIYGKIELYKEKPQIVLKDAAQIIRWE